MLIDLFRRPLSAEAPRSRALIDEIFALSGPDGGITHGEDGVFVQRPLREGGREAWDMLRRLRQKAWQKAGLDPDVLWTEKAQMMKGLHGDGLCKPGLTPENSADAETPRPRTLDAFHGLVKVAQAETEASQSSHAVSNGTNPKDGTTTPRIPPSRVQSCQTPGQSAIPQVYQSTGIQKPSHTP